jgi:hypothetical protein
METVDTLKVYLTAGQTCQWQTLAVVIPVGGMKVP